MERFEVYDPKGEMFEVTANRLQRLIVVEGWTFWHPNEKKQVFKDSTIEQRGTGTSPADGESGI